MKYDDVPERAVQWLFERGYLASGDCVMNPGCGDGSFSAPISRRVRIMVCMDTDQDALESTKEACAGGCKVELFERDWTSYVPSRGSYDSCVMSPSRLCTSAEHILRMEKVSSRSCAAVVPTSGDRDIDGLISEIGRDAETVDLSSDGWSCTVIAWNRKKG